MNNNRRYAASQQSHTIMKKQKFVHHNEKQESRNRKRCRPNITSSSLKPCRSILASSRKWSYSSRDFTGSEERLVVVSYNILGVENASRHQDLYRNISPKHMDWDYRRTIICKELAQYNPSILCFQEVDRFSDLQTTLHQDGFESVLTARTGDACDGCAIFWKKERFVLLHEEHINFRSFGLRNNVAQFCVLETADACRKLLVGNIHVLFNKKRGEIKLGQIRLFMEKAYKLSKEWGDIPIVLGGDFNSHPRSALYKYVSSGKLELLQHDPRNISGQIDAPRRFSAFHSLPKEPHGQQSSHLWNAEELNLATGSGVTCLQHNLKLQSAYLGVPNIMTRDDMGEPSATTCHSTCTETVDYIWHTEGLVPFRVLETLPRNVLMEMGGLPSEKWGSDHLALVCDFAFVDEESPNSQATLKTL